MDEPEVDEEVSPGDAGECGGCLIDGECFENGEAHPDTPCQVCLVLVDEEAWSFDDAAQCDDGDACTSEDRCLDGSCVGTSLSCDDGNPCTNDGCEGGECLNVNNSAPCDDGDPCTLADACEGGACQSGAARPCDDGVQCTTDACADGSCTHTASDGGACDDGNPCTSDDACVSGVCTGGETDCDDSNVCTTDACVPDFGCVNESMAHLCTDDNPCTDQGCDPTDGCVFPFNSDPCNDGSLCTTGDTCANGACLGTAVNGDDKNPCTDDVCDPLTGVSNIPNNKACSDGNACTLGDTCSAGACVAGDGTLDCDDGNVCTHDGCDPDDGCAYVPNSEDCDDGTVCTTGDLCAGGECKGNPVLCDDGNPCTTDACDAELGCQATPILNNSCRPGIVVTSPKRGATVKQSGPTITVMGSVASGGGPIESFTINGEDVPLAGDGSFSADVAAHIGGNTLVLEAEDALGNTRRRVQAFLYSDEYRKPIKSQPGSGAVPEALGIFLGQAAIDQLASLVQSLVAGINLGDSLQNPVYENSQYKVNVNDISHGAPTVSLDAAPGGLKIVVTVKNVSGDLHLDGKKIGCVFGACTYYPDINGDVSISTVTVNASVGVSASGGSLAATVSDVQVSMSTPEFDADSSIDFLLNPLINALISAFKGSLEGAFEGSIGDSIEGMVENALSELHLNFDFDMPSLDPEGEDVKIQVSTSFSGAQFNNAGGALILKAGAYAPKVAPYDNLGVPSRLGCGAGGQALKIPKAGELELVLADDFTNQLFYAAWLGGLLEFDAPPSLLSGADLGDLGITDLAITVSGMLAPTVSDCNPAGELLVHIGDMRVDANLSLLGQPMDVVMYVSFTASFEVSADSGGVGFALTEVTSLESELTVLQDHLIGSEASIRDLVEENLVPALLGAVSDGQLATVPLPEIELGGVSIGISPASVTRSGGNTIVSGSLK